MQTINYLDLGNQIFRPGAIVKAAIEFRNGFGVMKGGRIVGFKDAANNSTKNEDKIVIFSSFCGKRMYEATAKHCKQL